MINKEKIKSDDFHQFKTKIFFRTIIMMLSAGIVINFLYGTVWRGHFADFMIAFFRIVLRMNYDTAYNVYQRIFRNNMELILWIAVAVIFFIIFRIYLDWFAKYFREINKGIDVLIDETSGDVSLSPELTEVEKKINTIKHTLEKRKLDMQLSEQRKNDLIVYLAHDLKTPLASVIGYLNLLHDEKGISDELKEKYIAISLDKAERLEELINEFFEIAKFNLSNITLQYKRINLSRLFEMLLYEFKPLLQNKNLTCALEIKDDITINCDADKLQRVFDNLLRNAVIYSYEGTEIKVSAYAQDENIIIKFVNHGSNIPEDKLERIFEQFYRLDAARSTDGGGAGLGLAIAKQIVELHHGTIIARSENEITTFEVTLPY